MLLHGVCRLRYQYHSAMFVLFKLWQEIVPSEIVGWLQSNVLSFEARELKLPDRGPHAVGHLVAPLTLQVVFARSRPELDEALMFANFQCCLQVAFAFPLTQANVSG